MINNAAPESPFGPGRASDPVLSARAARRPVAVLDGMAWRHKRNGTLVVLRVERFADPEGEPGRARHRAAWTEHGERALEETWRLRWHERGRLAGWVEARRVAGSDADVDHLRLEDHTGAAAPTTAGHDPARSGALEGHVTVYEHLTVWADASVALATIRHRLGEDVDAVAARLAATLRSRLASAGRTRSIGPAGPSR